MKANSNSSEIIIIGGGVIGLTIARALTLKGARDICVIEKAEVGSEASFAAAGMLAPQVEADSNDEFFGLACRSRDMYVDFAAALLEETNVNVELDTTGTIYLALTEADAIDCERRYTWQSSAGLHVERLTSAQARTLEPCVNTCVRGALMFPQDIQVENRRLVSALTTSAKQLGVTLLTHTRCDEIVTDKRRVVGVKTTNDLISCNTIVLAAGCWSGSVRLTGSDVSTVEMKMEPVRGQMVCLEAKPQLTRHVIYSHRGYLVPRQDGRLLAGSTSEPSTYVKQTTAGGVSSILSNANEISPQISQLPIVDLWAGLRPKAADGLPVLGPCDEIDGLHYATGHYRNGILLAPITGELIANAIINPDNIEALTAFSPNRFHQATVGVS